jgi:hypothetical protein
MIRQSSASSRPDPLANRKASPFSKQSVACAFRVMAPSLVALTLATAAHAQGTMDFSGATTLMGTFNYRNDYVGVEQWSRTIVRDNYVYLVSLHQQHERFAKVWDNNLRLQGFAEAFEQQQTPRA